jgi:predicted negative regulator of RcsB-dependent stress response
MAKISRRTLKRNDLAETVGRTFDYVSRHRRGVVEGLAIALAVLLLGGGFLGWRFWRERRAGAELSAALGVLDTPLAADAAAQGAARTFPSAADREREADKHLTAAASRRGTEAGRAAELILAARKAKPTEALETFRKVARDGEAVVAAVAELDLARLLAAQGKTTEAIETLKRSIESPDSAAPKDALLFELAQIYERAGASADARAAYQRLVNDYPSSPYRAEARQKLSNT